MREDLQLEAIWSNSEVVEVLASPEVGDQSAAALEKAEGRVQATGPLPVAEEKDKDIHSCLAYIIERSKFLAELVLTQRRRSEARLEAREMVKKARKEMANRLTTHQIAWDAERTTLLAQLEESA